MRAKGDIWSAATQDAKGVHCQARLLQAPQVGCCNQGRLARPPITLWTEPQQPTSQTPNPSNARPKPQALTPETLHSEGTGNASPGDRGHLLQAVPRAAIRRDCVLRDQNGGAGASRPAVVLVTNLGFWCVFASVNAAIFGEDVAAYEVIKEGELEVSERDTARPAKP